ncbi:STM3941 family protein [Sphingopyxis sp. MSC1_008]|uniref:STM3941 family protein n=1 Tax=Sphingopyxis sp. MSC1_008 TaxID=2909265 RepID=UPI0020BF0AB2
MSQDPFIARDSWWRIGAAIAICAGFVWVSTIFLIPAQGMKRQIVGWIALVFFGIAGIGLLPRLFGAAERVRISSKGIYSRSWSDDMIPWQEISRISTWGSRGKTEFILLRLTRPDRFPPSHPAGYSSKANALFGVRADIWIGFTLTDCRIDEALAAIDRLQNPVEPAVQSAPVRPSFGRRRV